MRGTVLAVPDANILAHASRSIQIARALRELDYHVIFASEGKYVSLIESAGFSCEPHLTLDPEHLLEVCRKGRTNFFTVDFLDRCVEADCELFQRVRPDLILSDFRFSVGTSAEVVKIPHAVTLNALWTNYFAAPLSAPENTVYDKIFGKKIVSRFPSSVVSLLKELTLRHDVRAHNKIRRRYGLKPRKNLLEAVSGDINLIADLPEFAPTRGLPSHFKYVGPILWQPEIEVPHWLSDLDPSRRTVYATMGSSGDPKIFKYLAGIFDESKYQCLVTTAGLIDLSEIPPHIRVTEFAPGEALMQKSDLVICQGGNGTVYQALRCGLPIVGFPTMHDQHFNMDQVERLKMGKRLSLASFDPQELKSTVEAIFERRSEFKPRAKELASAFKRYPGPSLAATTIDQFLSGTS